MNAKLLSSLRRRRQQAVALILVIITVALLTILIVAIFSITQTEYKATQSFVAARSAKQIADIATNIVQAQIQNGHFDPVNNPKEYAISNRAFHATQPGMVRVYNANGTFRAAYKLYSSSKMKSVVAGIAGETALLSQDLPPSDWKSLPARYVDLNEPVIRPSMTPGANAVYFPIIDPRAFWNFLGPQSDPPTSKDSRVEGFSYTKTAAGGTSSQTYSEVVLPTDVSQPDRLRLPMPVEWMYILQDGTTGTLDDDNKFVSSVPGTELLPTNPIVGRVAFWTDDESCKINVNTAAEPTYMGTPFYFHDRDRKWAHYPASSGEYQRYPGHPATVALSAVLAPNLRLDPYNPSIDGLSQASIVAIKEHIYDMAPKIPVGGSKAGTLPFVTDEINSDPLEAMLADANAARGERLFASVDEMLFKDSAFDGGQGGRQPTRLPFPGSSDRFLFDQRTLERSRFFLTAHSRAPEFTTYGLPRICMWPVADESKGAESRTTFDNIIALCASVGSGASGPSVPGSYIFRRSQAHHPTYDVTGSASGFPASQGLQRNSQLLNYLTAQMNTLTFPRTSSLGSSANFSAKYGADNVNQLAIQIFDYIRCTNLYDGILARSNNGMGLDGVSGSQRYVLRDQLRQNSPARTYTDHRISPAAVSMTSVNKNLADRQGVAPGHGQVTPAIWSKGKEYRGFGRMFTLSEIGIQVICTADGRNDQFAVNFDGNLSGGGTAPRVDPFVNSEGTALNSESMKNADAYPGLNIPQEAPAKWYSNFPPLTKFGPADLKYGTKLDPARPQLHPSRHPGYQPKNWNMTLAADTPLLETQKRIQAIILLEAFCPSLGWTKFFPEHTIVLDGTYIAQIKINGKPLFDTAGSVPLKSDANPWDNGLSGIGFSMGGHASPAALVGVRGGRPIAGEGQVMIPSDRNYITNNPTNHNALTNYGLTSNCITVQRDQPMNITFPTGELKIDIYDTHSWESAQPIQTIYVKLADPDAPTTVPTPLLITEQPGSNINDPYFRTATNPVTGRRSYRRSLQGPHYWVYNYEGCVNIMDGTVNPAFGIDPGETKFWSIDPFFKIPANSTATGPDRLSQMLRGRLDRASAIFNPPPDAIANGVPLIPDPVSDTTRTFVPTMGDYRIMAAMKVVPSSFWRPHPAWTTANANVRVIHGFTGHSGNAEAGAVLAIAPGGTAARPGAYAVDEAYQLVRGAKYNLDANNNVWLENNVNYNSRQPDFPGDRTGDPWSKAAQSFGDFDTGLSSARDGPYINKPDEGNFFAQRQLRFNVTKFYRSSYFFESNEQNDDWRSGIYMTPNRLVSSPVMFGSLPTQVWPGGANFGTNSPTQGTKIANTSYKPWQTLLFRPHVVNSSSRTNHPGEYNPRDHNLLDMFFMPIVEPYAISEPLSVAGRVNLNYQIMPFTHIRRATGMHAVLKGEYMTTVADADATRAKSFRAQNATNWDEFFDEATNGKYWHRPINATETLRQFDERFLNSAPTVQRGLFRTASQICELYLIPQDAGSNAQLITNPPKNMDASNRKSQMDSFWADYKVTGDNVRERPYSNIYSRVTTRSNTFRVHMRAQVVRKARSTAPHTFDPVKDMIVGDYRGSTLIERYIDPTDTTKPIPDYGASSSPLQLDPLETFYKFRTLESKRFSP